MAEVPGKARAGRSVIRGESQLHRSPGFGPATISSSRAKDDPDVPILHKLMFFIGIFFVKIVN